MDKHYKCAKNSDLKNVNKHFEKRSCTVAIRRVGVGVVVKLFEIARMMPTLMASSLKATEHDLFSKCLFTFFKSEFLAHL